MDGWRNPARWARTGRWLLLPIAVLDWVALAPQTIVVLAFLIAVVGLAGMAAALVVHMLGRSRGAMAALGVVLLLGGLVVFGLDPFPGSFPLIASWWPESIPRSPGALDLEPGDRLAICTQGVLTLDGLRHLDDLASLVRSAPDGATAVERVRTAIPTDAAVDVTLVVLTRH